MSTSLARIDTFQRRQELFLSLDPHSHFNTLFNHLPDVHFFAKDTEGHLLFASAGLVRLYGFSTEEEFIGRTDFDILPRRLAEKYRQDDLQVMNTAEPLLGITELFLSREGIPEWHVTNKVPMLSQTGTVVGLMGLIQHRRNSAREEVPLLDIEEAVLHLTEYFAETTPVSELAEMCNLSVRQFEAKFQFAYNTSPHQFRIRLRVRHACELLRVTSLPVSAIAHESGFYDQSALARHFRTIVGLTPLQYRKQYASLTS